MWSIDRTSRSVVSTTPGLEQDRALPRASLEQTRRELRGLDRRVVSRLRLTEDSLFPFHLPVHFRLQARCANVAQRAFLIASP